MLNYYANREKLDIEFEEEFKKQVKWLPQLGNPYVANADKELLEQIAQDDMVRGVTIACGGFFGPQGRRLRVPLADPQLNEKIVEFEYKGHKVQTLRWKAAHWQVWHNTWDISPNLLYGNS